MSKKRKPIEGFAFTIIEDNGAEVIIEVSEEDYQRERAAGIEEEFLLKPGRHKLTRGGFQARHPEFKLGDSRYRKRA